MNPLYVFLKSLFFFFHKYIILKLVCTRIIGTSLKTIVGTTSPGLNFSTHIRVYYLHCLNIKLFRKPQIHRYPCENTKKKMFYSES